MAILVSDTFTDTNGTQLTAHTPDTDTVGTGWENASLVIGTEARAEIQGNQASITDNNYGAVIDAGDADVDVSADWYVATGVDNRNSLFARYLDNNNSWIVNAREPNGDIQLIENTSGSSTTRDSVAYSWNEDTTYALKFTANGTSIKGFVGGVEKVSYTSSQHQTQTKHGILRNNGNDASRFDNFLIESLGGGTTGSVTTSLDALISKTLTATTSLDALLSQGQTIDVSLDALLQQVASSTTALDALLSADGSETVSLDALLQRVGVTASTSLDALLRQAGLTVTVGLDAILISASEAGTLTVSLDALLQREGVTLSLDIDALLAKMQTVEASLDALLQQAGSESTQLDAILVRALAVTVGLDALLTRTLSATVSLDAILIAAGQGPLLTLAAKNRTFGLTAKNRTFGLTAKVH